MFMPVIDTCLVIIFPSPFFYSNLSIEIFISNITYSTKTNIIIIIIIIIIIYDNDNNMIGTNTNNMIDHQNRSLISMILTFLSI